MKKVHIITTTQKIYYDDKKATTTTAQNCNEYYRKAEQELHISDVG